MHCGSADDAEVVPPHEIAGPPQAETPRLTVGDAPRGDGVGERSAVLLKGPISACP